MLYTRDPPQNRGHIQTESDGLEKDILTNRDQKKAGVAILISDKEKLLSLQRDMAKNQSVVMDGRDIGTRILPNAEYKVFLVCPAEERARRRLLQLKEQGLTGDYDQILADIYERDHRDMTREISPLVRADDAIEFDTTGHTAESSANELIEVLGLCPKSC